MLTRSTDCGFLRSRCFIVVALAAVFDFSISVYSLLGILLVILITM